MWWRTVDRLGTFWNMRWLLGVRLPVELLPVELLHVSCGVVHCCMCIMHVVFLCGAMLLGPKFLVCRIVHWQFTCRNNNPDPKCCSMLSLQLFIRTLYKLKDMLYLYIPMYPGFHTGFFREGETLCTELHPFHWVSKSFTTDNRLAPSRESGCEQSAQLVAWLSYQLVLYTYTHVSSSADGAKCVHSSMIEAFDYCMGITFCDWP